MSRNENAPINSLAKGQMRQAKEELPQLTYRLVHAIPGRLRLRIPRLRADSDYCYRLKALVESVESVRKVRLNPDAQSIVIHYDPKALTGTTLLSRLSPIIQQAAHPSSQRQLQLATGQPREKLVIEIDRESVLLASETLTSYEQEQVRSINQWLSEEPGGLSKGIDEVFNSVATVAGQLIPDGLVQKMLHKIETTTNNWQTDWKGQLPLAQVEDYRQLKQAELPKRDRLADEVKRQAVASGALEGGLTAFGGWLGEGVDLPLSLLLAWQTVCRIGLCYGYSPEAKTDKQLVWVILAMGAATTLKEKRKAIKAWHQLNQFLYPQILKDLVQASLEGDTFETLLESLIRQIFESVMEKESQESLPILGTVLGVQAGASLIEDVSLAARRVFQTRWLLENEKLRPVVS